MRNPSLLLLLVLAGAPHPSMAWTPDGSNAGDAKAGLSAMRGLMGAAATGTTSFSQISRGLSALGADSWRVDGETTDQVEAFRNQSSQGPLAMAVSD
jgi:hypothetical protein